MGYYYWHLKRTTLNVSFTSGLSTQCSCIAISSIRLHSTLPESPPHKEGWLRVIISSISNKKNHLFQTPLKIHESWVLTLSEAKARVKLVTTLHSLNQLFLVYLTLLTKLICKHFYEVGNLTTETEWEAVKKNAICGQFLLVIIMKWLIECKECQYN